MKWQMFSLTVCVLCLLGCHKSDPVVGHCKATRDIKGTTANYDLEIHDDLTYRMTYVLARPGRATRTTMIENGSWKRVDDHQYLRHMDDLAVKVEGGKPAVNQRIAANIESRKATVISNVNKNPKLTITLSPPDQMVVNMDNEGTYTFSRVN